MSKWISGNDLLKMYQLYEHALLNEVSNQNLIPYKDPSLGENPIPCPTFPLPAYRVNSWKKGFEDLPGPGEQPKQPQSWADLKKIDDPGFLKVVYENLASAFYLRSEVIKNVLFPRVIQEADRLYVPPKRGKPDSSNNSQDLIKETLERHQFHNIKYIPISLLEYGYLYNSSSNNRKRDFISRLVKETMDYHGYNLTLTEVRDAVKKISTDSAHLRSPESLKNTP